MANVYADTADGMEQITALMIGDVLATTAGKAAMNTTNARDIHQRREGDIKESDVSPMKRELSSIYK